MTVIKTQTSIVVCRYLLQEWAQMLQECNNRPVGMSVSEWCQMNSITTANYYYRLKRVRQAYLDSAETSVTEFVEMPVPNEADNNRGHSCVVAVLHINQSFSMDLFDTASTTFIKNLLGAINHAQ